MPGIRGSNSCLPIRKENKIKFGRKIDCPNREAGKQNIMGAGNLKNRGAGNLESGGAGNLENREADREVGF